MKTFRLIESVWIGCNMSGADYYVATTDEEFAKFAAYAQEDESNDVTVWELVRFEADEKPPPMVGRYYAIWTDKANCTKCFKCESVADMEMVKGWHEGDGLYFATEVVI